MKGVCMIHQVFTVYDSKAEAFMSPFMFPSKGLAIRAFSDSLRKVDHPFSKHPEDFTLFCIGTYDDSKGKYSQPSTPESIGLALEFLEPEVLAKRGADLVKAESAE
jgi:hypothetical protein